MVVLLILPLRSLESIYPIFVALVVDCDLASKQLVTTNAMKTIKNTLKLAYTAINIYFFRILATNKSGLKPIKNRHLMR